MSNLPIGMMSIECEHASAGGSMSITCNQVATDFITRNCRDCPKHELIDIDNIGRKILDEEDEIKERRLAVKASPPVPAKVRLTGLVTGDLTAALQREHVTAQSYWNSSCCWTTRITLSKPQREAIRAMQ